MARRVSIYLFPFLFLGFLSCSVKQNGATETVESQPTQIKGSNFVRTGVSIGNVILRCAVSETPSFNELNCQLKVKNPANGEEEKVESLEEGSKGTWLSLEEKNDARVAPVACVESSDKMGVSCLVAAEAAVPMELMANVKLSDGVGKSVIEFDSQPYLPKTAEVDTFNKISYMLKDADTYSQIHLNLVRQPDYDLTKRQFIPLAPGASTYELCADIIKTYENRWDELARSSKSLMSRFAICKTQAIDSTSMGNHVAACPFIKAFTQNDPFKFVLRSTDQFFSYYVQYRCQIPTTDVSGDAYESNVVISAVGAGSGPRSNGVTLLGP